jgi:hypothetical protein
LVFASTRSGERAGRVSSVEHAGGSALVVDPILTDVEELLLLALLVVLAAAGPTACTGT